MSFNDVFRFWLAAILLVVTVIFAIRQLVIVTRGHMTWKDKLAELFIALVLGVATAALIVLAFTVNS